MFLNMNILAKGCATKCSKHINNHSIYWFKNLRIKNKGSVILT